MTLSPLIKAINFRIKIRIGTGTYFHILCLFHILPPAVFGTLYPGHPILLDQFFFSIDPNGRDIRICLLILLFQSSIPGSGHHNMEIILLHIPVGVLVIPFNHENPHIILSKGAEAPVIIPWKHSAYRPQFWPGPFCWPWWDCQSHPHSIPQFAR